MEIREDSVELTHEPIVTINNKRLKDCNIMIVEREMMKLLKRVTGLRAEVAELRKENLALAVELEKRR